MARIYFFGSPAHGHVNPTLPVVRELLARGHETVYFCTEEFREKVERTGAEFRAYEDIVQDEALAFEISAAQIGNPFALAALVTEGAELVLPPLVEHVKADPPDFIVHDAVSLWGKIIGRILDIPAASSTTTFAINSHVIVSWPAFQWSAVKMLLRQPFYLWRYWTACRRIRKRWGKDYLTLRQVALLDVFRTEEPLNLVYTSADWQPKAKSFPASYRFIGPCLRDLDQSPDFPWEALSRKPVLYISLGTIFHEAPGFYQACVEAFRDWPGVVVMTVGSDEAAQALTGVPEHMVVRKFAPQLALLPETDVFITHAGMNSASEALCAGVPLVAVPQGADQFLVARHIAQKGAGVHLPMEEANAANLRAAVEQVLSDDACRRKCAEIGAGLVAAGGAHQAAQEIEAEHLRRRGEKGARPEADPEGWR